MIFEISTAVKKFSSCRASASARTGFESDPTITVLCLNYDNQFRRLPMERDRVEEDFLNRTAAERFGIDYLFPYQRLVISNILEGAGFFSPESGSSETFDPEDPPDTVQRQIAILPTGAGKSLCFMLPGVLLPGVTLILFPLLSLLSDQKRRLDEQGIPAELLAGGQSSAEREAAWGRLELGKSRFLLSNPETLIQQTALRRLEKLNIDHLVIDEAHTLPMWGRQFRPALLEIPSLIAAGRPRMTSAFTATASDVVLDQIQEILFSDQAAHVIRAMPDRPNISYHVIPCLSKSREL
ncbi:MAG TPA: DEAD/DEAH box helicase, partial [Sediminispirochaeta sp.]|nr:DEAD/DEAH box helicase [Sediminispirochaeta sp.]